MISRVHTFVLQGIEAVPCEIEADLNPLGMHGTMIVGLPDTAVREAIVRVRTAIRNSGFRYPRGRLTINLAPADIPKEGPVYDLPIAVALLQTSGTIDARGDGGGGAARCLIAGELALDGRVRPIRGAISLALLARRCGARQLIVPACNAAEAAAVRGVETLGVSSLADVVGTLNGTAPVAPHPPLDMEAMIAARPPAIDFADVKGQAAAKRALTLAAAGGHNVLMIGPPGTGKSMLAKALPGILPKLNSDEALEVTRIYSSAGQLPPDEPLILRRPVRTPHHTASAAAIIGGGTIPRAGEVSLAHRGVLFLDEMPEFTRQVLETLRQPLEDGVVTISRARGSTRFPARFMLVGALNPTARGDAAPDEEGRRKADRYLARLSRPLVDRIDIHVEVPPVAYAQLAAREGGPNTAALRKTVQHIRDLQARRQGEPTNAELTGRELDCHASLDGPARTLVGQAMSELGLSARAYDKIRRVSRTIADLEGQPSIQAHHVAEAIQYRVLDRPQ